MNGPGEAGQMPAIPTRAYMIVALLFVFQTLNFFDKLAFGVSGVPMMHEFSLTPKQFGLIGAAFFLFFAVGGTVIGTLFVGRYRSKHILLTLAGIWTASQLPVAFTHSLPIIIACRLLLGIGEGAALATAMTAAYEWFPDHRRNLPSAFILQGISAGFLIGGPLLSWFVVHAGWRSCFLVCGVLSLVWMVLFALIGREGPLAGQHAAPVAHETPLPFRLLWLDRTVIGVMLIAFFGYWVIGMAAVWLPPFLRLGLGYAPLKADWIISAIYVIQSPALILGSWLTHTMRQRGWSARICLGWSSGLAMLVSGAALLAAVRSPAGVVQTCFLAIAFSVPSLTTIFGPVILAAIAPSRQRARLVVVIISATSISAFFSTFINGWIIGAYPGNAPLGFAIAFGLGGVILLAGGLASFLLLFPEASAARFAAYRQARDTGAGFEPASFARAKP
ncbi:MFS transporter [Acidiphilium sp. C61]|uniref:MFS transporter n=1 Tax=Acidiphilium sp. C61 TaxID=1671485 RepID=UPI00157B6690|nr:MFS transporter [Acidiphilium sp. C61]